MVAVVLVVVVVADLGCSEKMRGGSRVVWWKGVVIIVRMMAPLLKIEFKVQFPPLFQSFLPLFPCLHHSLYFTSSPPLL